MRFKRLIITAELFFDLFTSGVHPPRTYRVDEDAIPSDARLVNVRHGWPDALEILIESQSFEEVKQGDVIPELRPVITTL